MMFSSFAKSRRIKYFRFFACSLQQHKILKLTKVFFWRESYFEVFLHYVMVGQRLIVDLNELVNENLVVKFLEKKRPKMGQNAVFQVLWRIST